MPASRRHFLALAGFVSLIPLTAAAYDGGFELGHTWQVREYEPDGSVWEGTWTRRGRSPVFDAQWRNSSTGGVVRDVIEFRGVQGESVVLYRYGNNGTYFGRISRDGATIRRGTASWYRPGNAWEAQILG